MNLVSPPVGWGLGAHHAWERISVGGRRRSIRWQPEKLVEVKGVKATGATDTESQNHGSELLGSTPKFNEVVDAYLLSKALVLCHILFTQAARAKVSLSMCFNTSNRKFSSRFMRPISLTCSFYPHSSSSCLNLSIFWLSLVVTKESISIRIK